MKTNDLIPMLNREVGVLADRAGFPLDEKWRLDTIASIGRCMVYLQLLAGNHKATLSDCVEEAQKRAAARATDGD